MSKRAKWDNEWASRRISKREHYWQLGPVHYKALCGAEGPTTMGEFYLKGQPRCTKCLELYQKMVEGEKP